MRLLSKDFHFRYQRGRRPERFKHEDCLLECSAIIFICG